MLDDCVKNDLGMWYVSVDKVTGHILETVLNYFIKINWVHDMALGMRGEATSWRHC